MPRSACFVLTFVVLLGSLLARAPQEPEPGQEAPDAQNDKPKPERRGIPVDDLLVHTHCSRCHALDDKQYMTRISYLRKSPEGWSETIKRMGRLYGMQVSPNDARQLVRSLANSHGLTRSEAERGLYESERRVHWSEEQQDQDFRRACAQCHTLGRVLLQQRDAEEWQLLRATHVAMFPLSRGQMGGGPPDDDARRWFGGGGGGPPPAAPTNTGSAARGRGRGGNSDSSGVGGGNANPTQSVGDRVLAQLTKDQPLFTPDWEAWSKNRREVPLAGIWTVIGHDEVHGDLRGTATLRRTDEDQYQVAWHLDFDDGSTLERAGKGLLYAGYSWRGSSADPDDTKWKEVLLLDDPWQTLRGRFFTGAYDEIGVDVTLHRDLGRTRVLALGNAAVAVPTTGHHLEVYGEGFADAVQANDFFIGAGVTITGLERHDDRHVTLIVTAAFGSELGARTVAFRSEPGTAQLQLYDTVDYVRIRPLQGLARVGGAKTPKQLERFEAFAVHRGKDEKPFTDDDVDLFQVHPQWALAEFKVRDDDDDLSHVGSLDAKTGVFTPNVDGPNPARKWQANNVGDVFVTAAIELDVAVRPPKPKPKASAAGGADKPADGKPEDKPDGKPDATPVAEVPPPNPPSRERKLFRARSHLVVTVPLYVRWHALDWEDR